MKTDVLVIGSSAAGAVVATIGKRDNPNKVFTVVTKQPKTMIPCGIPYIFGSVGTSDKNVLPAEMMFEKAGIDVIHDEITNINRETKICELKNGEKIEYDKLVIATGSLPYEPTWLTGFDKKNVFSICKDKAYLDVMHKQINDCKNVIVIGAGFIGVEMADELNKIKKNVTLIEKMPRVLALAFDGAMSEKVETVIKERGINLLTGMSAKEIIGEDKVEGVLLENGDIIKADAVIIAMGYRPNTKLAKETGLPMSDTGFIKVDEYMRTTDPDVFAIGDCAEKIDFITRKPNPVMLASTACAEARTAGMNLFKLSVIKTFSGTISVFSTAIGDTGFGVAGLTENKAISEGFDIIIGMAEGIDRHPGALDDSHKQCVKLIVSKESGIILGGQCCGGLSTGELVNTIGILIQNRMNINSLFTAQIGTHPLLTASPAAYPMLKAVENALMTWRKDK